MEGAGFCRAALRFTTAENVHLVKVVSDTPDVPEPISPARGEQMMADAAPRDIERPRGAPQPT